MDKKPLIWISICIVFLLVLGSQTCVVGYQTVRASRQHLLQATVNHTELLLEKVKDFSQKLTTMQYQNVSIHIIIVYIIGFVYGLITWVPASLIILLVSLVLFVVIGIVETMIGNNFYWKDLFKSIFVGTIFDILMYPFLCAMNLVEKYP